MTKFIVIAAVIVLAAGIYYTGVYTYFLQSEVREEMPKMGEADKAEMKIGTRGKFVDVDFIHKGSGDALILEYPGKKILRLENFKVTNGPDLYVYLAKSSSPGGSVKSLGDFIDLGRLKGNIGDQNYELPDNADGYNSVVIWCKKFGVLFSYAVLK